MNEVVLDERVLDGATAHELLRAGLKFPAYYGSNLSALSDCLEDLCEPCRIICVRDDECDRKRWLDDMVRVIGRCAADNGCIEFCLMSAVEYDEMNDNVLASAAIRVLERLKAGNVRFCSSSENRSDLSTERVEDLFRNGQHPFATVVTCADSRVVPEHLFMCGLGDIFTIRVAGNIVSDSVGASAVYACGHLHTPLLVMLGHTACGAVAAALEGGDHGSVNGLVEQIQRNIVAEQDPTRASVLNAQAGVEQLRALPELAELEAAGKLSIVAALYHADTGKVEFL